MTHSVSVTSQDPIVVKVNTGVASGEANTASNLGGGEGVFASKSSIDLQFKSLVAGTGINLSSDANEITINAPDVGSVTSVDTGDGLSGGPITSTGTIDLDFTTPATVTGVAGDLILIRDDTDGSVKTIDFGDISGGMGQTNTMSNQGAGIGVFDNKNGVDFEMRTLVSQNGLLTIGLDAGNQEVDFTINEGSIDHDALTNFVANEHTDHSAVSINTGDGLSGDGDITATRTISLDFDTVATVTAASGDLVLIKDDTDSSIKTVDLVDLIGGGGVTELSDLSDVNTSTPTNRNVLVADGVDWESRALTEADISDLAHTTDASDLTSGVLADARVQESNVTQHEAAIDHDALTNFVANEHVDHSAVSINTGDGLSGDGDITATRTIELDFDTVATVTAASGDLMLIKDDTDGNVKTVDLSDVLGGGGEVNNNWLIANNGVDFTTAPTAVTGDAIALGENATASATDDIVIGTGATSVGSTGRAIVIGNTANGDGSDSIAIGTGATIASGKNDAIAIGTSASAAHDNSIAIGQNVTSGTDNSVRIGTDSATYLQLDDQGRFTIEGTKKMFLIPDYTDAGKPTPALVNQSGLITISDDSFKPHYSDGSAWNDMSGDITNGSDVGVGSSPIFKQKNGSVLEFYGITNDGGSAVIITEDFGNNRVRIGVNDVLTSIATDASSAGDTIRRNAADTDVEYVKNEIAKTTAPTVNSDIDLGYVVGSRWLDTTADKEYVCLDNTDGAAVWIETTGTGVTTIGALTDVTITGAAKGDILVYNGSAWVDLTVGSDDEVLTAASGEATGLLWQTISAEVDDGTFRITDDGDATKKVAFQASGITTATTRTITLADQDISLVPGSTYTAVGGTHLVADGTKAAPGVAFSADTDTGMYRVASGTIGLSADNVDVLRLTTIASGVNYLNMTAAASAGIPNISVAGSDSNVGMRISTKGTGQIFLTPGGTTSRMNISSSGANLSGSGSRFTLISNASAASPDITWSGNTTTGFYIPSANVLGASANGVNVTRWTGVASSVNYINFTSAITANGPTIAAAGSDSNVDLNLTGKGTGKTKVTNLEAAMPINTQTGTTYGPVLADADKMITLSNASPITVTIPANGSVAYPVGTKLNFMQLGAGQVTVAITTDTLNVDSSLTLKLNGQYAVATAFKVTSTSWVLFGNLEPA